MKASKWLGIALAAVLTIVVGTPAFAAPRPVVLELFTSHGCSSCPPADALLRKFSNDSPVANVQIIPLSEHVDYWDDLGWPDRFSDAQFTQRQRSYAHQVFASNRVYTPQMVVAGRQGMVGSRSGEVRAAIRNAAGQANVPVSLRTRTDGNNGVSVAVTVDGAKLDDNAQVWLALTQDNVVSDIGGGENAGRRLREDGVVRVLRPIGTQPPNASTAKHYQATLALPEQAPSRDLSVVAFVQRQDSHAIVGAARKPL